MNALRDALLRGRRRPRQTGAGSPTLHRGDGYEFVELRAYVPGDDVRRIDWAATARTTQLQTRVVLEDVALTLCGILDTSASMQAGRERPLSQSAREALQAWYAAAASDDRCMRVTGDELAAPQGMRGARAAQFCLAAAETQSFSLARALELACLALPSGAALMVASDWYDLEKDDAQLALAGRRFDCTALVARDPWYAGLPLQGFVRVSDAESGRHRRFYVGQRERRNYARAVRARETQLVERLRAANWRTELFDERDGAAALLRAFGLQ